MSKRVLLIHKSDGYVIFSFVLLLPLLLALAGAVGGTALILTSHAKDLHSCRLAVLDAQSILLDHMNRLTSLNPQATALRQERRSAEMLVQATRGLPPAHAAALARLTAVMARQLAFRIQQKSIIFDGETKARERLRRFIPASPPGPAGPTRYLPARMVLTKKPAQDLTPDYHPAPAMPREQIFALHWSKEFLDVLPSWIPRPPGEKFAINANCASAPLKGKFEWYAKLTGGKRF